MSEKASGGVSRSGRVRKKSAKLMEMDTPVIGSNTKQSTSKCSTPDPEIGKSANKKIKIKLSLGPHPSIVEDKSEETIVVKETKDSNDSVKKSIPPLKIPKSKITGVVQQLTSPKAQSSPSSSSSSASASASTSTSASASASISSTQLSTVQPLSIDTSIEIDTNDIASEAKVISENVIPQTPIPSEAKVSKLKLSSKKRKPIKKSSLKSDTSISTPIVAEPLEDPQLSSNESIAASTSEQPISVKMTDEIVTETPNVKASPVKEVSKSSKSPKSKKKDHETAANRIFRQITSGVTPQIPKSKSKKRKKLPIPPLSGDDEFGETSLVFDSDDVKSIIKPKKKVSKSPKSGCGKRDEKKTKKGKKSDEKPKKKRGVITAYTLWSKENRSKISQTCPTMDFASVSRKLGEIWQALPKRDKLQWRRKAQKLSGKGSSIISTGKPSIAQHSNKSPPIAENSYSPSYSSNQYDDSSDETQPIGTSPIDVAAHLRLLGESLNIIGQRLKEHSGQIAVSGSLSVLLDSTLCAIGPLLCLTSLDPNLDGCSKETHMKTLDNIAYIMPGI